LYADLYAFVGARWVEWGCFDHFALIPPTDPQVIEVWFGLCFGREQVQAIRQLSDEDLAVSIPERDLTIRRATPRDRAIMAEVSPWIARHLVTAPVWGVSMPEDLAEMREGYAELVDDASVTIWLAFRGDQVLGMAGFFPADTAPDDMLTPPSCTKLSVAVTHESARGSGVGLALTLHGLAQARAGGHTWCLADWRSTNLLASRFFPRRGFAPCCTAWCASDPRIIWANARDK
jgi:GNAT superfamily N-acetyltransferase